MGSKRAKSEAAACGHLARGDGERSTGAGVQTYTGGKPTIIDVGYSPYDIELVNLGEPNPKMMRNSNKGR